MLNLPRFHFRFGLRTLFVVMTLSAVASAAWWQWPRTQEIHYPLPDWGICCFGPGGPCGSSREVRRLQRQWNGKLLQHGLAEYFDEADHKIAQQMWVRGKRHGLYIRWGKNGEVKARGQYLSDEQEGTWVSYHSDGQFEIKHYVAGCPNGIWATFQPNGMPASGWVKQYENGEMHGLWRLHDGIEFSPVWSVEYGHDKIVRVCGRPLSTDLKNLIESGQIDKPEVLDELTSQYSWISGYVKTPLNEIVPFLEEIHGISLRIDSSVAADEIPISLDIPYSINFGEALAALATAADLHIDYQAGSLVLTAKAPTP